MMMADYRGWKKGAQPFGRVQPQDKQAARWENGGPSRRSGKQGATLHESALLNRAAGVARVERLAPGEAFVNLVVEAYAVFAEPPA